MSKMVHLNVHGFIASIWLLHRRNISHLFKCDPKVPFMFISHDRLTKLEYTKHTTNQRRIWARGWGGGGVGGGGGGGGVGVGVGVGVGGWGGGGGGGGVGGGGGGGGGGVGVGVGWYAALMHLWDSAHASKITYTFPNFNGCTVEVWEWISNFNQHFMMDVSTNSCWD